MNHADKTREPSVKYVHDEKDVYELWTIKDIKVRSMGHRTSTFVDVLRLFCVDTNQ